jgi:formylmethanofuran dehydrogenase subunit E
MKSVDLKPYLTSSVSRHSHLCPRQVLGVRIGLAGLNYLNLSFPRKDKRLLIIVETDGCFVSGIEAVTGVSVGRRTLRVEDYGKVAATFIDTATEQSIRIAPQLDIRQKAWKYAAGEKRRYFAQLSAYQEMPDHELLTIEPVRLNKPVAEIISRPGVRTCCTSCGEEIINQRELYWDAAPYCRTCTGFGYYERETGIYQLSAEISFVSPSPRGSN